MIFTGYFRSYSLKKNQHIAYIHNQEESKALPHTLLMVLIFLSIPGCRALSQWEHWFDSTGVEMKQITWQKTQKPTQEFLSSGSTLGLDKQINNILISLISFGVNCNRLSRTASSQVLSTSKDWSSTTSLGKQFQFQFDQHHNKKLWLRLKAISHKLAHAFLLLPFQ